MFAKRWQAQTVLRCTCRQSAATPAAITRRHGSTNSTHGSLSLSLYICIYIVSVCVFVYKYTLGIPYSGLHIYMGDTLHTNMGDTCLSYTKMGDTCLCTLRKYMGDTLIHG
jgi:hypothetical protein